MTLFKWSTTAASNATIDDTINAREGQAPSTVNDAMRGIMAAIAKWRNDLSGNLLTAGSSTAYTLTTNQGYTSLTDGISVRARLHTTGGAAPTLNVDGLGARSIATVYGTAMPTGAILEGGVYDFVYDSTDNKWITVVPAVTRASLGLATTDSPQFEAINLGAASDTTITRVSAGNIAVEGNAIYRAGGTDVAVADGGTGASTAADAFTNLKQAATTSATGVVALATPAQVAAQTANVVPTCDILRSHPGIAKVLGTISYSGGTPTLEAGSVGVFSVIDTAQGRLTVTLSVTFATDDYQILVTMMTASGTRSCYVSDTTQTTTTFEIQTRDGGPNLFDPTKIYIACFGALA